MGKTDYKGGSFPLLIRMEERMGEPKAMLPNARWVAAHLANACVRKLAYQNTFEACQLQKEESSTQIIEIT